MKNKLELQLEKIKSEKRLGLMAHAVVGYPSLDKMVSIVKTMAKCGADIIELQIPFSDPLADGPTIMKACEESLNNGTKVKDAFVIMHELSKKVSIPLLFMGYFNTVFKYGVKRFCEDAMKAGASGLIVPDMPLEEEPQEHFYTFAKQYGLHVIHVLSPASTEERMKKNAKVASGFIYCTARQGITGVKDQLDPALGSFLKRVRKHFTIPVAVGFGISKKEHLKALEKDADIAIIGSAIIEIINKSNKDTMDKNIEEFFQDLINS
jgi:tryptophan synthase alpha chain